MIRSFRHADENEHARRFSGKLMFYAIYNIGVFTYGTRSKSR